MLNKYLCLQEFICKVSVKIVPAPYLRLWRKSYIRTQLVERSGSQSGGCRSDPMSPDVCEWVNVINNVKLFGDFPPRGGTAPHDRTHEYNFETVWIYRWGLCNVTIIHLDTENHQKSPRSVTGPRSSPSSALSLQIERTGCSSDPITFLKTNHLCFWNPPPAPRPG